MGGLQGKGRSQFTANHCSLADLPRCQKLQPKHMSAMIKTPHTQPRSKSLAQDSGVVQVLRVLYSILQSDRLRDLAQVKCPIARHPEQNPCYNDPAMSLGSLGNMQHAQFDVVSTKTTQSLLLPSPRIPFRFTLPPESHFHYGG